MDGEGGPADVFVLAVVYAVGGCFLSAIVSVILASVGKLEWSSVLIAIVNGTVAAVALGLAFGLFWIIFVPSGAPGALGIIVTAVITLILLGVCVVVPLETAKRDSQCIWRWTSRETVAPDRGQPPLTSSNPSGKQVSRSYGATAGAPLGAACSWRSRLHVSGGMGT